MTIAYFDCFSGIAGDMALGALLDCGVPRDALREGLASLPVEGWDITAEPVLRSGIHALNVSITLHGRTDADEAAERQAVATAGDHHGQAGDHHGQAGDHHGQAGDHHGHAGHKHGHDHHNCHGEHHGHDHDAGHHHAHGRTMGEIRAIIEASNLSPRVKATSLAVFERIAAAEGHLHHKPADEVHFHEIGGIDSLIDICGVAWCLEYLGIDEVHCSPLPLSSGFVDCAHGRMPVPAPATLELLKGIPMVATEVQGELVTPTGAGIVAALCRHFGAPPSLTVRAVGHGSGKRDVPGRANILRVLIGDSAASAQNADGLQWESLSLLETNLDDMNPELYQFVLEKLFAAGALDAWLQPIQMKKGRPAMLLAALCAPETEPTVVAAMLRETTTLGVRVGTTRRAALPRRMEQVSTPYGPVGVKVADCPQLGIMRAIPEYCDVERLARENNLAVTAVYQAALAAAGNLVPPRQTP